MLYILPFWADFKIFGLFLPKLKESFRFSLNYFKNTDDSYDYFENLTENHNFPKNNMIKILSIFVTFQNYFRSEKWNKNWQKCAWETTRNTVIANFSSSIWIC